MKLFLTLRQEGSGALWLEKAPRPPRRVATVTAACKRLRRTRRQVYRLLMAGRLGAPEKLLGEWLLDYAAIETLALKPLTTHPLPARLKHLFPEYETKELNAGKDDVLIISRVLEGGGRKDVRWLLQRYPTRDIRRVVTHEGSRLLSARSLRFWSLFFKTTPRPLASWRLADPWREAAS
ncbi:MAG: hypothetical protein AAB036_00600 [Elusimicrobiota bacterium]